MADVMMELLIEYAEMFHENFPIFLMKDKSDEEIKNAIRECIKNKKKSDLYLDPDANC